MANSKTPEGQISRNLKHLVGDGNPGLARVALDLSFFFATEEDYSPVGTAERDEQARITGEFDEFAFPPDVRMPVVTEQEVPNAA